MSSHAFYFIFYLNLWIRTVRRNDISVLHSPQTPKSRTLFLIHSDVLLLMLKYFAHSNQFSKSSFRKRENFKPMGNTKRNNFIEHLWINKSEEFLNNILPAITKVWEQPGSSTG